LTQQAIEEYEYFLMDDIDKKKYSDYRHEKILKDVLPWELKTILIDKLKISDLDLNGGETLPGDLYVDDSLWIGSKEKVPQNINKYPDKMFVGRNVSVYHNEEILKNILNNSNYRIGGFVYFYFEDPNGNKYRKFDYRMVYKQNENGDFEYKGLQKKSEAQIVAAFKFIEPNIKTNDL
jgi:nuclear transport factor 2 (NTF2) superfamily protein